MIFFYLKRLPTKWIYLPILWRLYIMWTQLHALLCGTFQLSTRAPLTTVVVIKRVRIRPACFPAIAPLATFPATTGKRASLCVSIIILLCPAPVEWGIKRWWASTRRLSVRLSVCPVPDPKSRMEGCSKLKISRKEAALAEVFAVVAILNRPQLSAVSIFSYAIAYC